MSTGTGEPRLLIDGKLTEAETGRRFENVNPATEEVLGDVADASTTDMRGRSCRPRVGSAPTGAKGARCRPGS